jgi:hypothetical protein
MKRPTERAAELDLFVGKKDAAQCGELKANLYWPADKAITQWSQFAD